MKNLKIYKEQRYVNKFGVKLKKVVTETKEMLDVAYNESAMSEPSIYHRYNEFKSSRKNVEWMSRLSAPTVVLLE